MRGNSKLDCDSTIWKRSVRKYQEDAMKVSVRVRMKPHKTLR